jgi:hypothetical protein
VFVYVFAFALKFNTAFTMFAKCCGSNAGSWWERRVAADARCSSTPMSRRPIPETPLRISASDCGTTDRQTDKMAVRAQCACMQKAGFRCFHDRTLLLGGFCHYVHAYNLFEARSHLRVDMHFMVYLHTHRKNFIRMAITHGYVKAAPGVPKVKYEG